ncbi:MAG: hypothetical protein NZ912_00295 [Ignisphaera sp.]|nr:hypothetical protein [Ignisphaera sp.]
MSHTNWGELQRFYISFYETFAEHIEPEFTEHLIQMPTYAALRIPYILCIWVLD